MLTGNSSCCLLSHISHSHLSHCCHLHFSWDCVISLFLVHKPCCHIPLHLQSLVHQLSQCQHATRRPSVLSEPCCFPPNSCSMFPNPPTQDPLWQFLVSLGSVIPTMSLCLAPLPCSSILRQSVLSDILLYFCCYHPSMSRRLQYHPLLLSSIHVQEGPVSPSVVIIHPCPGGSSITLCCYHPSMSRRVQYHPLLLSSIHVQEASVSPAVVIIHPCPGGSSITRCCYHLCFGIKNKMDKI